MEIKLLILGLFVVTFVQGDGYNEGEIGLHYIDRRQYESHIKVVANNAHLEHSIPSEDEATFRFKRQHFTHNHEWHRRHGIDMPHERNDTTISNNGDRRHHFMHNREWHERHGIPMPGDSKNHTHHHHSRGNHHRHPHRRPNHRATIPTTTTSPRTSTTSPTSCEM